MKRFIITTEANARIRERWLVTADTAERAQELVENSGSEQFADLFKDGEDMEHLDDESLDEEGRGVVSVTEENE